MNPAEETVWEASEEVDGLAPMNVTGGLGEVAQAYLAAWRQTWELGCGHPTDVRIGRFPLASMLCPTCAVRLGFHNPMRRCGVCSAPVGDHGVQVVGAAADAPYIILAAFCATHAKERTA